MGEHLEREIGMFYNESFHKTEIDNKIHQKNQAVFKNKENSDSGEWAGCGMSILWS